MTCTHEIDHGPLSSNTTTRHVSSYLFGHANKQHFCLPMNYIFRLILIPLCIANCTINSYSRLHRDTNLLMYSTLIGYIECGYICISVQHAYSIILSVLYYANFACPNLFFWLWVDKTIPCKHSCRNMAWLFMPD